MPKKNSSYPNFLYCSLFFAGLFLFSCNQPHPVEHKVVVVKKKQDINKITAEELEDILSNKLSDSLLVLDGDSLKTICFFDTLYKAPYNTLFIQNGKYNSLGDSLFNLIQQARYYGLIPDDYHAATLDTLRKTFFNPKDSTYDAFALARSEMLMCDAYFKMGVHLHIGRLFPDSLAYSWQLQQLDSNFTSILINGLKILNPGAALDSLEPKHEGYVFLKAYLRKFIVNNSNKDWEAIPFSDSISTDSLRTLLKTRLLTGGFYDSTKKGNDSIKLAWGIKQFQLWFNLEPDGKLGKYTQQALGYSKESTIRQIEMAMERWRWENRKFPDIYLWANIPSAELRVIEKDTLVMQSNIVVGKPETPTPLLKSKINYLLIYPYWNVPLSIATKEILPALQKDTSYLRRKNFEVIGARGKVIDPKTIRWKKYTKNYLPFQFRQRIGSENSLGVVKFNFNNKYGVYLHDTNSKKYFKTFYRFQSHGCMRIEKYLELAKFLIREDTLKLPYDTLTRYFNTPEQRKINLRKPPPIYIRYYTCMADSSGLHFYIDIYKRDELMSNFLYKKHALTAVQPLP